MKGRERKRKLERRKLLSCSWHRLAWLVGYEMTSLTTSLLFSIFLSPSLSPPPAITSFSLLPFLSSWIIKFLALCDMPAFALFHRYSNPRLLPLTSSPPSLFHQTSSALSSLLVMQRTRCRSFFYFVFQTYCIAFTTH